MLYNYKSFSGYYLVIFAACFLISCGQNKLSVNKDIQAFFESNERVEQNTYKVWKHPENSKKDLLINLNTEGKEGFYVYDKEGNLVNKHLGLKGIANMAIAYGLELQGKKIDVLVVAEKERNALRVFKMPELTPIDSRGIQIFNQFAKKGWTDLALVDLHITKQVSGSQKLYAIVDAKDITAKDYRVQYELMDNGRGSVEAKLVHKSMKEDFVVYTEQQIMDSYVVESQK
ncbi:MAG: phytase [Flavobacteriaceae bacterium]|jgi:3-phytase|nr:phytase [Flavobacteriaceae bacterium]